jgi:hypothetical protein
MTLLLVLCVTALPAAGASAQTTPTTPTPTSTTPSDTTSTVPEQVGQDLGDTQAQAPAGSQAAPSPALPMTGWRGRDALGFALLLLAGGLGLRRLSAPGPG